jgi:hypothetical protein
MNPKYSPRLGNDTHWLMRELLMPPEGEDGPFIWMHVVTVTTTADNVPRYGHVDYEVGEYVEGEPHTHRILKVERTLDQLQALLLW